MWLVDGIDVGGRSSALGGLARLADHLVRADVTFCAIGGMAAARWLPDRFPADLDIVVAPTRRDSRKLVAALISLVHDQGDGGMRLPFLDRGTPRRIRRGHELTISTRLGSIDVVGASLPEGCDRRQIVRRREWVVLADRPIPLCSLRDLIDIKSETGRLGDAADVALLRATQDRHDA